MIALVLLLALAVAYVAQKHQNDTARDHDRQDAITQCIDVSESRSYAANGFERLAARVGSRDNPGDQDSSREYQAIARSIIATLPGSNPDADVERIETLDGSLRFTLSQEARESQEAACVAANKG